MTPATQDLVTSSRFCCTRHALTMLNACGKLPPFLITSSGICASVLSLLSIFHHLFSASAFVILCTKDLCLFRGMRSAQCVRRSLNSILQLFFLQFRSSGYRKVHDRHVESWTRCHILSIPTAWVRPEGIFCLTDHYLLKMRSLIKH